jgi:hypothetical protein
MTVWLWSVDPLSDSPSPTGRSGTVCTGLFQALPGVRGLGMRSARLGALDHLGVLQEVQHTLI